MMRRPGLPSRAPAESVMRVLDLSVPSPGSGERLDRFLAAAQTDLSRSRLQGLIEAGRVQVNGRPVRAALRLREGDRVRVEIPEPEPTTLVPEELPLSDRKSVV